MYGNILMVFGGPEACDQAWQMLVAQGTAPWQREHIFYYQTEGEDESFSIIRQLREAGVAFHQIFINNPYGSFIRTEQPEDPDLMTIKTIMRMSL